MTKDPPALPVQNGPTSLPHSARATTWAAAASPLRGMRSHFGIRPGRFQIWYDQVAALSLGHLAGGIHRNGEDFFNLYYGAATLPPAGRRPG